MRLRVLAYAALFAFAPLLSFIVGAIYSGFVESALSVSCFTGGGNTPAVCMPGILLTLSGFMPAVMIFTIPAAILFVVGYALYALRRSGRAPPSA